MFDSIIAVKKVRLGYTSFYLNSNLFKELNRIFQLKSKQFPKPTNKTLKHYNGETETNSGC